MDMEVACKVSGLGATREIRLFVVVTGSEPEGFEARISYGDWGAIECQAKSPRLALQAATVELCRRLFDDLDLPEIVSNDPMSRAEIWAEEDSGSE